MTHANFSPSQANRIGHDEAFRWNSSMTLSWSAGTQPSDCSTSSGQTMRT